MKTKIAVLTCSVLFLSASIFAQSPLDKVFSKYSGQDKFTTVSFSKEMFTQIMAMMGGQNDSATRDMKDIVDKLTGMKVITYSIDTNDYAKAVAIYNEWSGLFPSSSYKELMSVTEGRDNYRFMTKQDNDGKVSEMVMLMKGKKELVVLSLTGVIDLANISKISRTMGIRGMDGFQKMKNHGHQAPPPQK
jgi:hypothetical protein